VIHQVIPLFLGGNGYPVMAAVDLKGAGDRRVHGVTALVVRNVEQPWCLIADHPENEGVSATNGFGEYAQAICRILNQEIDKVVWFEMDSMGRFDIWTPCGENGAETFFSIIEPPHETSSHEAFRARLSRLGLRHDGNGPRMMIDSLREPFMAHDGMILN